MNKNFIEIAGLKDKEKFPLSRRRIYFDIDEHNKIVEFLNSNKECSRLAEYTKGQLAFVMQFIRKNCPNLDRSTNRSKIEAPFFRSNKKAKNGELGKKADKAKKELEDLNLLCGVENGKGKWSYRAIRLVCRYQKEMSTKQTGKLSLFGQGNAIDPFPIEVNNVLAKVKLGKALIKAGKDLIEAGKALIKAGKGLIEVGEALIKAGKDLIEADNVPAETGEDLIEADNVPAETGVDNIGILCNSGKVSGAATACDKGTFGLAAKCRR